jgi:hypothetical protein
MQNKLSNNKINNRWNSGVSLGFILKKKKTNMNISNLIVDYILYNYIGLLKLGSQPLFMGLAVH